MHLIPLCLVIWTKTSDLIEFSDIRSVPNLENVLKQQDVCVNIIYIQIGGVKPSRNNT